MPKPDDNILLTTIVSVAKEQEDLKAAACFLQVLTEASFKVEDNTPYMEAYYEIKNYFKNRKPDSVVHMDIQNNSGTISAMEGCTITNRLLNYCANADNNPQQLRTGQSY